MITLRLTTVVGFAIVQSAVLGQQINYGFPEELRRINARTLVVGGFDAGTPENNELIALCQLLDKQYVAYRRQAEELNGSDERIVFYADRDPSHEFIPRLLTFESQNRGTLAGLMALRKIVQLASLGGRIGNVREQARREAIKRSDAYRDHDELIAVLGSVCRGNYEPATEAFLRSLAQDEQVSPRLREFSRLAFVRWVIHLRNTRADAECRMNELAAGDKPKYPLEKDLLEEQISSLPSADQLQLWEKEAVEALRTIIVNGKGHYEPTFSGVDPWRHIIQVDDDPAKNRRSLSEIADSLLFRETYLRLGEAAPEMNVDLISGKKWSLDSQQGRVVIVQFSFKGCVACEAMYPDLHQIQEAHGKRVSILSVMADETRAETEDAISDKKLTWNVHWEGLRGPLATRWEVTAFPTVYVIDPQGRMAATGLKGEGLKSAVTELLD